MRFKFIDNLNIYAIYSTESKFYECVRITLNYQSYLCIFQGKYCSDDSLSLCYYIVTPGSSYLYNLYNIIKANIYD